MTLADCLSTSAEDISSKTTGSVSFKFHMQPLGKVGKKIYIVGQGNMTKMATMPIIW